MNNRTDRRIQRFRTTTINYLEFYDIENLSEKSDDELINFLNDKIYFHRRYAYDQNNRFEQFLKIPITNQNEQLNLENWEL